MLRGCAYRRGYDSGMNPLVTGALSVVALYVGWLQWGWQGLVVAVTVIGFALTLQFTRTMRLLRRAADAPVGHVKSAVMLQAKLRAGQTLAEVIGLTGSLGKRLSESPETFEWRDAGGDAVQVVFERGRCTTWQLQRAAS